MTPWPCRRSSVSRPNTASRCGARPIRIRSSRRSLLINGYVEQRRIGWDFEDESPGRDARGFARDGAQPPEIETHLVNAVLTNGARYYVDHAHPEYSTPECADPLEATLVRQGGGAHPRPFDGGGAAVVAAGQEIVVYKNNSDGKGNSYGCHENYLVDRNVPFAMLVRNLIPWFVTRQVFTGAGKVGSENGADRVDYQISQRADFFEEEVGLETTLKRPIVNTRDEPHADPQKYRRLHVIVGDANLCEVATFLKVGTTAIVLAMIEDGFIDKDLSISSPVAAIRAVSHDPTLAATVDSRVARALHRDRAAVGVPATGSQVRRRERARLRAGREASATMVLDRWEAMLSALESDPSSLDGQLDWVTKFEPARGLRRTRRPRWNDPKLELLSVQYHDVRPDRSLYEQLVRGGQGRTAARRERSHRRDGRSTASRPGRISAARASPAGPTRWSPRTGTAWCSTSGSIRCEGSR